MCPDVPCVGYKNTQKRENPSLRIDKIVNDFIDWGIFRGGVSDSGVLETLLLEARIPNGFLLFKNR